MQANHLHFECYSGISGDMILGALVDLGVELARIEQGLKGLPIGEFALRAEQVKRQGIVGTRVHVEVEEEPHVHRHLRHINEIVEGAGLPERVTERAKRAYLKIAQAEAHVHGSTVEKIHFHEVGAKDAIVDVAGAMLGVELLGIESFSASPIVVGFGTIDCRHGRMPVPAPATAWLLQGMPHAPGAIEAEMATPTGVAILATLLEETGERGFESLEALGKVSRRIGYGAGKREFEKTANYLRLWLCESSGAKQTAGELPIERETIALLECEVDDMSPELAGYLMERLLAQGALDVQFSAVQMKKNRPGQSLRVICRPEDDNALAECLLRETTTFGVRRRQMERWALRRQSAELPTALGTIRVKIGYWGDEVLKVTPEYESCRALAEASQRPLRKIYEAAWAAIQQRYGGGAAPNHTEDRS